MRTAVSVTVILVALLRAEALAQRGTGEIRLVVRDATGAPVHASGIISSDATHVERRFSTDDSGASVAPGLPFGLYRIAVESPGFAPYSAVVDIRSEVPARLPITLAVAGLTAAVRVAPDAPLVIDPYRSGTASFVGADLLRSRASAPPGHSIVDLVNTLPGWFETSNGVLHPRGAEYQVQYVVDGVPLRDNRSPAFAQSLGVDEFESLTARTAGYPAEFGGKLGGVIELTTVRDRRDGWHGAADGHIGSFATLSGCASAQYVRKNTMVGASGEGMRTDRYLDPPVEANYTNHGSGHGLSVRVEQEWNESDRTRAYVHRRDTQFLVPNEQLQEAAGQRQDRSSGETLAQVSHQHVASSRVVASAAVMARRTSAALDSNAASTPIRPEQRRGFDDVYANGSVSAHAGRHELKAGGELSAGTINERFSSEQFSFEGRRTNREQAGFAQDLMRFGPATLSIGLRFDHYRLVESEHALSPRVSASYFSERARLVVHGSYDRAFETPPIENVLLASAGALPLLASRGHFVEGGVARELFGRGRIDVNVYRRNIANFFDDDLVLNTAISFPFTFAHATVSGVEASLDVPRWGPTAASFRYSYSRGTGSLPLSGGFFLARAVEDNADTPSRFPISEDQRHTVRGRLRVDATPRLTLVGAGRYDSGLPIEIDNDVDAVQLASQYGREVLDRVDVPVGRVRPSYAFDASAALVLRKSVERSARVQLDVFNLFDRLNVINFASLLSGTAIGAGRSAALRLRLEF